MASVTPNQYTLHNSRVKIAYSTSGFQGQPQLSYNDGQQTLTFQGPQIRTVNTEIGSLVSVTTEIVVDRDSVSYTILIPVVALPDNHATAHVHTYAVITKHLTPLGPPQTGQRESYSVEKLEGVAKAVVFAAGTAG